MISYKFLIVLALISGAAMDNTTTTPTTTTATTTTPTTTTATTTYTPSYNSCAANLGSNQPTKATDCTVDTSIALSTCCYINMSMTGISFAACTPIPTATITATGTSINSYFTTAFASFNATMNSFSCSSAYVSVSFVLLFLAALLF